MQLKMEPSKIANEALQVLLYCQKRDYAMLDKQVEMGRTEGIIKDLSFGRLALSIDEQHYELLTMIYPQISSNDPEEKTLAWKAFMEMDLSIPYRVNASLQHM